MTLGSVLWNLGLGAAACVGAAALNKKLLPQIAPTRQTAETALSTLAAAMAALAAAEWIGWGESIYGYPVTFASVGWFAAVPAFEHCSDLNTAHLFRTPRRLFEAA